MSAELTGDRVQCLECGHIGVDITAPDEWDEDYWLFECPECGAETEMQGPIGMPVAGGPISDWGAEP